MSNCLKELRQARGFSRYSFARALGVDPATIWRWEQSDTLPSDTLKELARVLNCAATEIDPELGIVPLVATTKEEPSCSILRP
jgi:transcriptional regulator with XRE-family HTH domain